MCIICVDNAVDDGLTVANEADAVPNNTTLNITTVVEIFVGLDVDILVGVAIIVPTIRGDAVAPDEVALCAVRLGFPNDFNNMSSLANFSAL